MTICGLFIFYKEKNVSSISADLKKTEFRAPGIRAKSSRITPRPALELGSGIKRVCWWAKRPWSSLSSKSRLQSCLADHSQGMVVGPKWKWCIASPKGWPKILVKGPVLSTQKDWGLCDVLQTPEETGKSLAGVRHTWLSDGFHDSAGHSIQLIWAPFIFLNFFLIL